MKTQCRQCSSDIETTKYRLLNGRGKYCSKKCLYDSSKKSVCTRKENKKKYMSRWRKLNREREYERTRIWKKNNPEKMKEYRRRPYVAQKARERSRRNYWVNPKKYIERVRVYVKTHPDRVALRVKSYRNKNKIKIATYAKNYRDRNKLARKDKRRSYYLNNRQKEVTRAKNYRWSYLYGEWAKSALALNELIKHTTKMEEVANETRTNSRKSSGKPLGDTSGRERRQNNATKGPSNRRSVTRNRSDSKSAA